MESNCFYCKYFKHHVHFYSDYSSLYECLKLNNEVNTDRLCGSYRQIENPSIKRDCFEVKTNS